MRSRPRLVLAFAAGLSLPAIAKTGGVDTAIRSVRTQLELLNATAPFVERSDVGRILYFRNLAKDVLERLESDQAFHRETLEGMRRLYLSLSFSKSYFAAVRTGRTEKTIERLLAGNAEMARQHGLQDPPKLTRDTFDQMEKLIRQLSELSISPKLRSRLAQLLPEVAKVSAKGSAWGDSWETYEAAIPVCRGVQDLYRDLLSIRASETAYEIAAELQGINDLYVERVRLKRALRAQGKPVEAGLDSDETELPAEVPVP